MKPTAVWRFVKWSRMRWVFHLAPSSRSCYRFGNQDRCPRNRDVTFVFGDHDFVSFQFRNPTIIWLFSSDSGIFENCYFNSDTIPNTYFMNLYSRDKARYEASMWRDNIVDTEGNKFSRIFPHVFPPLKSTRRESKNSLGFTKRNIVSWLVLVC